MEEELKDTKGVIRMRNSKKNRQHKGKEKKDRRTYNHLSLSLSLLFFIR
jgi:hypothetical protein